MKWLPLLLPLLLLPACDIRTPPPPLAKPVPLSLPKPVWPDRCVADWYAHATLPPCVEGWIGNLTEQQKQIEKKHQRKIRMNGKPGL